MNVEELKIYANLLEKSIEDNLYVSDDVVFLANYDPLKKAIADAKEKKIDSPRNMGGLSYWLLESNIRDIPDLSDKLSGFLILLKGWEATRLRDDDNG